MAKKKDKEKDRNKDKKRAVAENEPSPMALPAGAEQGANNPENEMRRIAREAAWARMFGRNDAKNPFTGQT